MFSSCDLRTPTCAPCMVTSGLCKADCGPRIAACGRCVTDLGSHAATCGLLGALIHVVALGQLKHKNWV